MKASEPLSALSHNGGYPLEPLAVPPQEVGRLIHTGLSHVYKLMRTGELISFRSGRARRVTMQSVHDYIARQLAADSAEWRQIRPPPRRQQRQGARG